MTFLIADDNARMRESVKRYLERNIPDHHTYYDASDGTEAVKLFYQCSPDWILMDIEMEPMDGLTALKTIHVSHPAARVIILTSYDDAQYRKSAKDFGALAYVMKSELDKLSPIMTSIK